MVREHHRLNGHESEQTLRDSGGQRGLACCSLWSPKELDLAPEQQQQMASRLQGDPTSPS